MVTAAILLGEPITRRESDRRGGGAGGSGVDEITIE